MILTLLGIKNMPSGQKPMEILVNQFTDAEQGIQITWQRTASFHFAISVCIHTDLRREIRCGFPGFNAGLFQPPCKCPVGIGSRHKLTFPMWFSLMV